MNEQSLRRALAGLPISEIKYYSSTGSTNDVALAWAAAGAPDGALVTADMQTAGRGRLGRTWVTRLGAALAFSLALRPRPGEAEQLGLFSPLGALAVCQALEDGFGLSPQIKWPNDVLFDGQKLCGILLESSWLGDNLQAVVIGIGLNVSRAALPPHDQVLFPATTLEDALGKIVEREDLLRAILKAFFAWRDELGSARFLQAWDERLAYKNEWVNVEASDVSASVSGQVLGVAPDGRLRLQDASGRERLVTVGDVRLRPAERDENLGGDEC